jgi:plastocyanin
MPQAARQLPTRQPRAPSRLALLCWFTAAAASAGDFTVTAKQRNERPLAGAVITLEAQASDAAPAPPQQAVMDQVNMTFVPDVLVVPVHSRVQFPNSDVISHQVYSFSGAKPFQLPLYRGKPYPPVQFDQPGVVTLGCNIHDNMIGYIFVTAAPYFGRTDAHGEWQGRELPHGRIRVRVWHPLLNEPRELERAVELGGERGAVELRLVKPLRPAPLPGRPRSWDY